MKEDRANSDLYLPEIKRKDRRCYTIKIIPHHDGPVKSISLPIDTLKKYAIGAAAFGAVFVASLAFATYGTFTLASNRVENHELKAINTAQQAQISELAKKANGLQDQVSELGRIESEIKQLAGVEVAAPENAAEGGGETAPASASATPETTDAAANPENVAYSGQGGPYIKPSASNVEKSLINLEQRITERRESLARLKTAVEEKQAYIAYMEALNAVTPTIWPTYGDVSSPYGFRWGGSDFHPGIDIANDYGTPIVATADGYVTAAGWDNGGYGNKVDIDHGMGVKTRYAHAQSVIVSAGETVKKGQVIAYMGSTGFSTGPHCHYEISINGENMNPANYMK